MDVPFRGRPLRTGLEGHLLDTASAALAGLAVVATRLPLRTNYLLNWDAAQFALGVRHFDVVHHQPHPPGYLGYVVLGKLLLALTGDVNAALVAISIAGEALAVAAAYLFARSLFGRPAGWVTALALCCSPLYWYYGEAANTYALEPALALLVAWLCWRLWNGSTEVALPAALALGLAGAIRPSTSVLLAPLFGIAIARQRSLRLVTLAAAVLAAAVALWVVPLVVMAGGPGRYWSALTQLGGSVSAGSALWRAGLGGLLTNASAVVLGLVWDLGPFAVVLLFGLAIAPRLGGRLGLPPGWAAFCWLWCAPALLTFLFVHIGEVAYVQVFAPALFLTLGPALRATAEAVGRMDLRTPLVGAAVAGQLAIFFLPHEHSLAGQLTRHDAQVAEMVLAVRDFDPSHTVLVTDAVAVGSYRTAQVYLPEYHRVALGADRRGSVGEIYGDEYEPWRLDRARQPDFPPGTTTLVFLDRSVVDAAVADRGSLRTLSLPAGLRLYVWQGAPPTCCLNGLRLDPDAFSPDGGTERASRRPGRARHPTLPRRQD